LASVDLSKVTSIGKQAFRDCPVLKTFIIRQSDSVCTLTYTYTFKNTLIESGNGYIYVPDSLLDQYRQATNWAAYADQIRALEDYTVDGTTTGELDESKI
jgi:hypothetical protein